MRTPGRIAGPPRGGRARSARAAVPSRAGLTPGLHRRLRRALLSGVRCHRSGTPSLPRYRPEADRDLRPRGGSPVRDTPRRYPYSMALGVIVGLLIGLALGLIWHLSRHAALEARA